MSIKLAIASGAVIALSLFFGLTTTSQTSSAAPPAPNYTTDTIANKVKAYNYYVALTSNQCNFGDTITGSDISNYQWLLASNPHQASGTIGPLDCSQAQKSWIKDAMSLWGFSSNSAEDLCSLGMTQTKVSSESLRTSCGKNASLGSGDEFEFQNVSKRPSVLSAIRATYFNNQEPVFDNAMIYYVALQDFFNKNICSAQTPAAAGYGSTQQTYTIKVAQSDGSPPKDEIYTIPKDNTQNRSTLFGVAYQGAVVDKYAAIAVPCSEYPANANADGTQLTVVKLLADSKYAIGYLVYLSEYLSAHQTNDPTRLDPTAAPVAPPPAPDSKSTCAIDGIGWIVCPVMNFMGTITDTAFNFLAANFLETKSNVVSAPATVSAWNAMRDIANVAFVIAFMIIIFSQLTSVGITNYGVKKMLPRLVIAAILVNASYLICLLAVDISNILGYSLKAVFDNLQNFTKPSYTSADASGNGWGIATMIAGLVAGGITLAFAISIPVLLAALLALMLIVLILFGRTALIILLIVVSPLAFVAYLLPNTEQWFKKWYKMFSSLLLVFPIIAVVVGASGLAAGILKEVAGTDKILQVIAIGVATIPLFVVPSLLKSALGSAGAIGAKLNGLSSKLNGKVKSQGSKTMEGSRIGQYKKFRAGEGAKRTAKIQSGTYEGRGGNFNPRNLASSLNSRINQSSRSGKFGDRATAQGAALEDAEDAELKKNAASRLDYYDQPNGNPLSQDQMMQIATGQDLTDEHGAHLASASSFDTHTRKAAIEKAAKIATVSQAQQLTNASSARNAAGENLMSAGERKTLSAAMAGSSAVAKAPWLGGRNLGDIDQGTATTDGSALRAINEGKVSADSLAHSDATGIETLLRVARGTSPDAVRAKAQLKAAHADYLTQPLLHTGVASGSAYAANLATIATF